MLSSPLRHHDRVVIIVLAAPTPNSTTIVAIAEITIPSGGAANTYGNNGTAAPRRYATPTVVALLSGGSATSAPKPNSSRIIIPLQRDGSDVICATI